MICYNDNNINLLLDKNHKHIYLILTSKQCKCYSRCTLCLTMAAGVSMVTETKVPPRPVRLTEGPVVTGGGRAGVVICRQGHWKVESVGYMTTLICIGSTCI